MLLVVVGEIVRVVHLPPIVDYQTPGDHVQERAHRREHQQLQAIGRSSGD